MNRKLKLTAERVRELLNYDPLSGLFTWKVKTSKRIKVGSIAGRVNNRGYVHIGFDGKKYTAHRLAFLVTTGAWPADEIDHANGIPSDNRWSNLRPATRQQNMANTCKYSNNASGAKGVHWHNQRGKWRTTIMFNGRRYHVGLHATVESAAEAYAFASRLCFGEFHNTGD